MLFLLGGIMNKKSNKKRYQTKKRDRSKKNVIEVARNVCGTKNVTEVKNKT